MTLALDMRCNINPLTLGGREMMQELITFWPTTRTGKLIFKSTNQALEAALEYFDHPPFIHYLEKETKRLRRLTQKALESKTLNLDNACKLATRMQLNNEALARAYSHRKYQKRFEETEEINNGDCN